MNYHEHLKTEYWHEVARRVKASAGFKCQVCNSPRDLVAHHRTYAHVGNELNHLGDLICLCSRCHVSFHQVEEVNGVKRPTVMPDKERVTPPTRLQQGCHRGTIRQLTVIDKTVSSLYDHAADMPKAFPAVIDAKLVAKFLTRAGGITRKTMQALNVPAPLVKSWPKRLIGQVITEEQCRAALVGRECRSTARTLNLVPVPA